jgi:hypothetical protein
MYTTQQHLGLKFRNATSYGYQESKQVHGKGFKKHKVNPFRSLDPSDNKSIRSNERVDESIVKKIPLYESGVSGKETQRKLTCRDEPSFSDYIYDLHLTVSLGEIEIAQVQVQHPRAVEIIKKRMTTITSQSTASISRV